MNILEINTADLLMKNRLHFSLLIFCFFFLISCEILETKSNEKIKITVGGVAVRAEIAATPEERARGLMYRTKLPENEGMLFIYAKAERLTFWMKNTLIPLDIGFFDSEGYLINIYTMEPEPGVQQENLKTYSSSENAKYALEMNKGWFKKNNIRKFQKLNLPAKITPL